MEKSSINKNSNFFTVVRSNVASTRQSRSRVRQQKCRVERTIDRETVLKINRHPTRRHRSCVEFQWPPHNESRPHVNTNTQRFDNKALSKRQVVEIREFFDNYERNSNELWGRLLSGNIKEDLSDRSKSAENLKFDKHNNFACRMNKICQQGENQSCHTLSSSTSNLLHIIASERPSSPCSTSVSRPPSSPSPRKCFYLPEEKIHSNELLVKIRQHFDKSHDKQRHSSGICNVDSASNQNKIGKTKNHNSASCQHSSECDGVHRCTNDGVLTSPPLFNECDQKIFRLNEYSFNESATTTILPLSPHHPPLEEPLCYRVSKQQQSALIKNDNAISCGVGSDSRKTQDATITTHRHAVEDELSGVMAVGAEKQKHYHCKDLKPIKSLEFAATRENEIVDDGKQQQEEEPLAKHKQQQQLCQKQVYDERYNSILMNDDCKMQQQMQDEQTSSSSDGKCRDKYFKDSKDSRRAEMLLKSDLEINEISTNNSIWSHTKINTIGNNLNLDPYFDKELSAWSTMGKRTDNEFRITADIRMGAQNDFESNSCSKLDNETMANCNSDSTSDSSDDCTSTTSSSSEYDPHIIATRSSYNHQTTNSAFPFLPAPTSGDNNGIKTEACCSTNMRLFTDGTYIYGPYEFDLFTNSFYHFRDTKSSDYDEASFLQHHDKRNPINAELLKNHDDINTKAVPCVRDIDATYGKSNILNDRVVLNATNYSKDDERDFNYSPPNRRACDLNLIDLMDEGDSYVSKIREKDDRDLHRSTLTDYVNAVSSALLLTADTVDAAVDLNNSEQFNYERDKIVEITDEDDALATVGGGDSEKHKISSRIAGAAECTTAVNEKFSNHEVPKIKILGCDGGCVEGVGRASVGDEIRFRECERREMCDKFHSSVNDNDNIARDECQG